MRVWVKSSSLGEYCEDRTYVLYVAVSWSSVLTYSCLRRRTSPGNHGVDDWHSFGHSFIRCWLFCDCAGASPRHRARFSSAYPKRVAPRCPCSADEQFISVRNVEDAARQPTHGVCYMRAQILSLSANPSVLPIVIDCTVFHSGCFRGLQTVSWVIFLVLSMLLFCLFFFLCFGNIFRFSSPILIFSLS